VTIEYVLFCAIAQWLRSSTSTQGGE